MISYSLPLADSRCTGARFISKASCRPSVDQVCRGSGFIDYATAMHLCLSLKASTRSIYRTKWVNVTMDITVT